MADALATAITNVRDTRYSELASSLIIIYDYILTFDQEVSYIWNARWSIGKVVFFMNRYYSLFVVCFNNYGLHWFKWQGWTGLVACALAEVILQLRLYALYNGERKVTCLMVGFFLAAMATSGTIMGEVLSNVQASANSVPTTKICVPVNALPHLYAFWIPILAFETLLCGLAILRGYWSYRNHELRLRRPAVLPRLRKDGSFAPADGNADFDRFYDEGCAAEQPSLLEILLRDSLFYYIVMFATYLTTTLIWIFGSSTTKEIPIGFTVAMSTVIGNRLLFNLRNSRRGPDTQAMMTDSKISVSFIQSYSSAAFHVASIRDEHGREVYELSSLRSLRSR